MCSAWSSSRAQLTSSPGCSADFARPYPRLAGPPRTCSGRPVPTSQHAASPGAALPPHLVLELVPVAGGVDIVQVLVGERSLRAMVAPPVPGMTGHRVQVPSVLLDVLTVITLRVREAERPLLQDRVPPVPQRQGQPQPLLDVAEPGQPVLPPPVGPRPGVVVRQVVPRVAVGAVVLPDRALLPLADVRPPPVPVAGLQQPVSSRPNPATRSRSALIATPSPSFRRSWCGVTVSAGQLWCWGWFSCITHVSVWGRSGRGRRLR
jgi:hypothetical protein